jgi:hypothetical protein
MLGINHFLGVFEMGNVMCERDGFLNRSECSMDVGGRWRVLDSLKTEKSHHAEGERSTCHTP